MLEPVSPSGTGKTLSALISSTWTSRLATAARTASTSPAPSQARRTTYAGALVGAARRPADSPRPGTGRERAAGEPLDVDRHGCRSRARARVAARSGSRSRPAGRPRRPAARRRSSGARRRPPRGAGRRGSGAARGPRRPQERLGEAGDAVAAEDGGAHDLLEGARASRAPGRARRGAAAQRACGVDLRVAGGAERCASIQPPRTPTGGASPCRLPDGGPARPDPPPPHPEEPDGP